MSIPSGDEPLAHSCESEHMAIFSVSDNIYPDGSPDVFGRYHLNNGDTIFNPQERSDERESIYLQEYLKSISYILPAELTAFDALSITELNEGYKPNVATYWNPPRLNPGQTVPTRMIVTSPNVCWMPYISLLPRDVRARADGRFGLADFTVCPQWWIDSHWHLPFVRARPPASTIKSHALSFCWWDVDEIHFFPVEGSAYDGLGTLQPSVAENLRTEAKKLRELCGKVTQQRDQGRLSYLVNKLNDASIQLKFCNFTMRDLVYRVAGFQRLYLEALAMYEWHMKWSLRCNDPTGKIYEVDETIMGVITDKAECAMLLFRIGIPVWYVRPPADIPNNIIIRNFVAPGSPLTPTLRDQNPYGFERGEFVSRDYRQPFPPVHRDISPRSFEYVTGCQSWKEGQLGAIEPQPIVKLPPSGLAVVESFVGPSHTQSSQTRTIPGMCFCLF